jgi:hypothetical protein
VTSDNRHGNAGFLALAQCQAVKADGNRCGSFGKAIPEVGGVYCFQHDPRRSPAERRERARFAARQQRGKHSPQRLKRMLPPRLVDVYEKLEEAMGGLLEGSFPPTRATAMATVATAMVRVLERGEHEQMLRDLERAAKVDEDDEADVVIEG